MLSRLCCLNDIVEEVVEELGTTWSVDCSVDPHNRGSGLVVEEWSNGLQVVSVEPGTIRDYNESAPEGQRIGKDDFVVAIGTVTHPAAMLALLHSGGQLSLQLVRPRRRKIA